MLKELVVIHHFDKIINFFPNSKIIFSYRNPLETAISMRNYPFFRMYELMINNKNYHIGILIKTLLEIWRCLKIGIGFLKTKAKIKK